MANGEWRLTVTFDAPDVTEWWDDGSELNYPLTIAGLAKEQWEHDDEISSLVEGRSFSNELLWKVNEDHTEVVLWSNILDALVDIIHAVLMRTIPERMVLEVETGE